MTTALPMLDQVVPPISLQPFAARPFGSLPWGDTLDEVVQFLERWGSQAPASIVVPIFNGGPHVARCLSSLTESTPAETEIILVDDHSTESDIAGLCRTFAESRPGTRVITNEQNFGYVTSVNVGIRAAQPGNDIILLNSDTVTPPGWLYKLRLAAAARPGIASVSPLSNAAGVFSVPTAYEDRALPDGMTVDLADQLLSLSSERRYEVVPVSCGFCMYLRREALTEVGLFDDRLFLRGYGEENDWCERARSAGFRHVVDESCFVAHSHGASFGREKTRLKRRNGSLVKALYPRHVEDTKEWLASSGLEGVRTSFRELWAQYRPNALPTRGVRIVLEQGVGAVRGSLDTIAVRINEGRCQIDLFGIDTSTHTIADPTQINRLLACLMVRWNAASIEVSPEQRGHLDPRIVQGLCGPRA